MLRIYFQQQGFNLSDPDAEDARSTNHLCCVAFARVDLGLAAAPDETTIFRFRRLLERTSSVARSWIR